MSTLDINAQHKLKRCILRGVSLLVSITCILAMCTAYIESMKKWANTKEFLYTTLGFGGLTLVLTIIMLIISFRKDVTEAKIRYAYALSVYIFLNMGIILASALAKNKHMVPISIGISILILLAMSFVGMKAKDLSLWGLPLYCALLGAFVSQIVLFTLMFTDSIPRTASTIGLNVLSGFLIFVFTMYIAYDVNMFVKNCDMSFRKCCEAGTFFIWEDFAQILMRLIGLMGDIEFQN